MRTLQTYKGIFKEIANNLNLQGDAINMLIQLLSQASYISEVENVIYSQEASKERCSLINSKIQHCMDEMYSVPRGQCPRVIIRFKPTNYLVYSMFDVIASSNNFRIYYLGYLGTGENSTGSNAIAVEDGFVYAPYSVSPSDEYVTIIGLLASEIVTRSWTLDTSNIYYVDCTEENLSNDIYVTVDGDYFDVTRQFSDHILNPYVFDLTIPSFGSRLYIADIFKDHVEREETETPTSTVIDAAYFKYSTLSSYNESELKKLKIRGAELVSFGDETWRGVSELTTGLIYLSEISRPNLNSIHYKAARDRYVNSIIRSNSDIGTVLEETYPEKVVSGGTNYEFDYTSTKSDIKIYYVPKDISNPLTTEEIAEFVRKRKAYYVTDDIEVILGDVYTAVFNIDLELYQTGSVDYDVISILTDYEKKFSINLEESVEEIKALISKISNVKQVKDLGITYLDPSGDKVDEDNINTIYSNIDKVYFYIDFVINSTIQTIATT